jgi:glucose dehydrogenase
MDLEKIGNQLLIGVGIHWALLAGLVYLLDLFIPELRHNGIAITIIAMMLIINTRFSRWQMGMLHLDIAERKRLKEQRSQ